MFFPQVGDQAFYFSSGGINHTGIVVKVEGSSFTAVEGNYSDKVSLVQHNVGHSDIAGFGRPNWNLVSNEPLQQKPKEETKEDHSLKLRQVQMSNAYSDDVVLLQALLNKRHFPCGSCDGFFGAKTQAAVNSAQRHFGLTVDGICGQQTWKKIMEVDT